MKKLLLFFAAILFAGSMMGQIAYYEKVTTTPADWTGDYLIAYVASETDENALIFDGSLTTLDAVSNTQSVTLANNGTRILATEAINACKFTIAYKSGSTTIYSLKSASGKYISGTTTSAAASNGLKSADTDANYEISFSVSNAGVVTIYSKSSDQNMVLKYNSSSNQTRFRFYKSGQQPITLFKYVGGSDGGNTGEGGEQGGEDPEPTTFHFTTEIVGQGEVTFKDANQNVVTTESALVSGTKITPAFVPADGYEFTSWEYYTTAGTWSTVDGTNFTLTKDVKFRITFSEVQQGGGDEPSGEGSWTLCSISDLTASDIFVIVDANTGKAMTNDQSTSAAPNATAVTVSQDGNTITSVTDVMKWNISGNGTNGYTIYPNGSTTTWLYCTATNNGLRVGTNASKTFVIENHTNGEPFLKHSGTSRYVGVYNSADWRCYTSVNSNIESTQTRFYKYVTSDAPGKTTPTLSFSPTTYNYTLGDEISAPVLSNPENVAVTYTASNVTPEGCISVTPEGVLSINAAGTATITASSAESETYNANSASYTIVASAPEPTYASVTSPILGYEAFGLTPNGGNTYAQPDDNSHQISFNGITLTLTKNEGTSLRFDETYARIYQKNTMTITAPATCKIMKIVLNKAGGDWKGGMTVSPACATYNDGDNAPTWTGEETSVTFTPGGTHRLASVTVYLDKKVGSFKVTNINGMGWGTYYTDFAFVMPTGVEGQIMKDVDGSVTNVTTYEAGAVVPAETALLLKGTAGTYNLVETATAPTISAEGNLLKGLLAEGTTTGGNVYYLLANGQNGLGWYYGAANGAAFTTAAHKAYLALSSSSAPARILLNMDGTDTATSIDNIESKKAVKFFENGQVIILRDGVRYNALGQMVK